MITPRLIRKFAYIGMVLLSVLNVLMLFKRFPIVSSAPSPSVGPDWTHLLGSYLLTSLAVAGFAKSRKNEIALTLLVLAGMIEIPLRPPIDGLAIWATDAIGVYAVLLPVWLEDFRRLSRSYEDLDIRVGLQASRSQAWVRRSPSAGGRRPRSGPALPMQS